MQRKAVAVGAEPSKLSVGPFVIWDQSFAIVSSEGFGVSTAQYCRTTITGIMFPAPHNHT